MGVVRRPKTLALILAAALLAFLLAAVIPSLLDRMFLSVAFRPIPFDFEVWKATPAEFSLDSVRLRMVDDLLATRPFVGQHRDGIVELLGEPDDRPSRAASKLRVLPCF